MGRWDRALQWYALSIAEDPHDHDTHAAIGFTYHLLRRFDEAISSYHRALALHPSSAFCAEMLSRALEDICLHTQSQFQDTTAPMDTNSPNNDELNPNATNDMNAEDDEEEDDDDRMVDQ